MSTHALRTSEAPATLRAFGFLDLVILAVALPVFLLAGFPLLGYAAAAIGWLVQRGIRALLARRAEASDDVRAVVGFAAVSMLARGWLMALTILGVGLVDEDAGLAAAILVLAMFTVYFTGQAILRPFDHPGSAK